MKTFAVKAARKGEDVTWYVLDKETGYPILWGVTQEVAISRKNYLVRIQQEAFEEGRKETS